MRASRSAVSAAILGWCIAAFGVWAWMSGYGFKTYAPSEAFQAERWPRSSSLALADERPTLLLFLHPRCPCTTASVRELEKLLADRDLPSRRAPKLIAVATLPAAASEAWRSGTVVEDVARLPNAVVAWDVGGVEAARFGAVASGTVMLFEADGARVFAGGITASRGHEGPSAGGERLAAALRQKVPPDQKPTPVFGCRLCVAGDTAHANRFGADTQRVDALARKGKAR
jgi:hypothetical protein